MIFLIKKKKKKKHTQKKQQMQLALWKRVLFLEEDVVVVNRKIHAKN